MSLFSASFGVALFLLFPAVAQWLAERYKWAKTVGPVSICYLVGMTFANQPLLEVHLRSAELTAAIAIGLAIPLLLFSMDVLKWFRMAKATVLSFFLAVVAVFAATVAAGLLSAPFVARSNEVVGMLAGVYTGGTPNLGAVGMALGSDSQTIVNTNASDLFVSAIYAFFLFTIGGRVIGRFLKPYPLRKEKDEPGEGEQEAKEKAPWHRYVHGLGLAVLILVAGAAVFIYAPERWNVLALTVLTITTLAVVASFSAKVRSLPGTYDIGQYVLLIFCIATGSMADFSTLFTSSLPIFVLDAVIICSIVLVHLGLSALFKIDTDTMIITSTATIFSPAFVPPVADALKNREMVIGGIASGLMGFAIGNYLGVAVAWLTG
jgi:uncharacterized membrane protein